MTVIHIDRDTRRRYKYWTLEGRLGRCVEWVLIVANSLTLRETFRVVEIPDSAEYALLRLRRFYGWVYSGRLVCNDGLCDAESATIKAFEVLVRTRGVRGWRLVK